MASMTEQRAWELAEREKYRRLWKLRDYHTTSPGRRYAPQVADRFHVKPGDSLTDFGCGDGTTCEWFADQGMQVRGVDLVPAWDGYETRSGIEYFVAPLWDLPPELPKSDIGFCADVLEHIPELLIPDVLHQLSDAVHTRLYLAVAHFPDSAGNWDPSLAGQELHLTLHKPGWWVERFMDYLPSWDLSESRVEPGRAPRSHWYFHRG